MICNFYRKVQFIRESLEIKKGGFADANSPFLIL
jgi:hypothetical protein